MKRPWGRALEPRIYRGPRAAAPSSAPYPQPGPPVHVERALRMYQVSRERGSPGPNGSRGSHYREHCPGMHDIVIAAVLRDALWLTAPALCVYSVFGNLAG